MVHAAFPVFRANPSYPYTILLEHAILYVVGNEKPDA